MSTIIGQGIGIPFSRVLGGVVSSIVNAFKQRVVADSGTFEAENCLNTTVQNLTNNGLYDKASLIVSPNAYKASKIYSLKPTSGAGDLTFARASAQTRRNSAGVIENLANNVPALDYPTVGGCPWWNFPLQRTNLFLNSQAPVTQNITVVNGSTYTVSVGEGGSATLSNAGTGSATSTTPFTFVASTTTLTVTIVSAPIWCQVELGAYASPLIVTSGSALTRVISNPNTSGLTSFIGQTEGGWYTEFRTGSVIPANGDIVSYGQNITNNVAFLVSGNNIQARIYHNSTLITIIGPAIAANTTYKCAVRYQSGNSVLYVNGTPYTNAAAISFTAALTQITYTNAYFGVERYPLLFGKNIFFLTPPTNAELLALTS
jgi:hypothetical protein